MLEDFIALSEALTGVRPLDRTLANEYLGRFLTNQDVGGLLPRLISVHSDIVRQGADPNAVNAAIAARIMGDDALRPAAQQLIYLWYVSAFFKKDATDPVKGSWQYGPAHHYERALVWSVIRSHAPMTRGGPFGYWSQAPAEQSAVPAAAAKGE